MCTPEYTGDYCELRVDFCKVRKRDFSSVFRSEVKEFLCSLYASYPHSLTLAARTTSAEPMESAWRYYPSYPSYPSCLSYPSYFTLGYVHARSER